MRGDERVSRQKMSMLTKYFIYFDVTTEQSSGGQNFSGVKLYDQISSSISISKGIVVPPLRAFSV